MNQSISICPTHNIKYDPSKYQGCIQCTYKQCLKCGKYNIKHNSQYQTCFICNQQDKQQCVQCKTNMVKLPFKYCYNCNQQYKKQQPITNPTPQPSLEPVSNYPTVYQFPMKLFRQ